MNRSQYLVIITSQPLIMESPAANSLMSESFEVICANKPSSNNVNYSQAAEYDAVSRKSLAFAHFLHTNLLTYEEFKKMQPIHSLENVYHINTQKMISITHDYCVGVLCGFMVIFDRSDDYVNISPILELMGGMTYESWAAEPLNAAVIKAAKKKRSKNVERLHQPDDSFLERLGGLYVWSPIAARLIADAKEYKRITNMM